MVCPPISNSAAARITGNPDAESVIRQSDFYMICARAEAKFSDLTVDDEAGRLHFSLEVPGVGKDAGWIDIGELPEIKNSDFDSDVRLAYGADHVLVSLHVPGGEDRPIAGFAPDDVLFWRGRKSPLVGGLDRHLDLATYDLLYVGIAKVGDSYDRLFAKGHYARMQILANEPQRHPGARVSDETFLFLFKVEPLFVRTFGPESKFEDGDLDFSYDGKRLVADAEKAFVHLLRPKYNSTLYANYPRGKDGLYASGLTAYTYSISEGIALLTKFGRIKGGRERELTLSNEADFIMVKGDDVTFHISGVDFAAD
tara:strand:- start:2231 stop:3166 length:936 start_codon:yes stop_codon:yes gene_type:complete